MRTVLKPCRVPWSVSPTMDALTLHHMNDDEPRCCIVFGGGRLGPDGLTDDRRIEIKFSFGYFARINVKSDNEDIEASGFDVPDQYDGPGQDYLDWRKRRWRETGICPDSGFYLATVSPWLDSVNEQFGLSHLSLRHFLLAGRDNYIELLAKDFALREWLWLEGARDQFTNPDDVVGSGSGVE
jgi:hypothetical protein